VSERERERERESNRYDRDLDRSRSSLVDEDEIASLEQYYGTG
jgi:hypothetical protein